MEEKFGVCVSVKLDRKIFKFSLELKTENNLKLVREMNTCYKVRKKTK